MFDIHINQIQYKQNQNILRYLTDILSDCDFIKTLYNNMNEYIKDDKDISNTNIQFNVDIYKYKNDIFLQVSERFYRALKGHIPYSNPSLPEYNDDDCLYINICDKILNILKLAMCSDDLSKIVMFHKLNDTLYINVLFNVCDFENVLIRNITHYKSNIDNIIVFRDFEYGKDLVRFDNVSVLKSVMCCEISIDINL